MCIFIVNILTYVYKGNVSNKMNIVYIIDEVMVVNFTKAATGEGCG